MTIAYNDRDMVLFHFPKKSVQMLYLVTPFSCLPFNPLQMRKKTSLFILCCATFALNGCVAQMAADVVTAPFKIVGKGVDIMTTSQSEADENRGRALRKHEEKMGKYTRKRNDAMEDCQDGDKGACRDVEKYDRKIAELRYEQIG